MVFVTIRSTELGLFQILKRKRKLTWHFPPIWVVESDQHYYYHLILAANIKRFIIIIITATSHFIYFMKYPHFFVQKPRFVRVLLRITPLRFNYSITISVFVRTILCLISLYVYQICIMKFCFSYYQNFKHPSNKSFWKKSLYYRYFL